MPRLSNRRNHIEVYYHTFFCGGFIIFYRVPFVILFGGTQTGEQTSGRGWRICTDDLLLMRQTRFYFSNPLWREVFDVNFTKHVKGCHTLYRPSPYQLLNRIYILLPRRLNWAIRSDPITFSPAQALHHTLYFVASEWTGYHQLSRIIQKIPFFQ